MNIIECPYCRKDQELDCNYDDDEVYKVCFYCMNEFMIKIEVFFETFQLEEDTDDKKKDGFKDHLNNCDRCKALERITGNPFFICTEATLLLEKKVNS